MKFDKNTIAGIVLIIAIVTVFMVIQGRQQHAAQLEQFRIDSTAAAQKKIAHDDSIAKAKLNVVNIDSSKKVNGNNTAVNAAPPANNSVNPVAVNGASSTTAVANTSIFLADSGIKEQNFIIENELVKINLSNRGGKVTSVELKNYKTWEQKPLVLFNKENNHFNLAFFANNQSDSTGDLLFSPEGKSFSVAKNDSDKIVFRAFTDESKRHFIEQSYELKGNSYMVNYHVRLVNMDSLITAKSNPVIYLSWKTKLNNVEQSKSTERNNSSVYYHYTDDAVEHILEGSKEGDESFKTSVEWISFKQHFFNSALISSVPMKGQVMVSTEDSLPFVKTMNADLTLPYTPKSEQAYNFKFYFGPNDYYLLKDLGYDLHKVVCIAYGPFGWFASPISKFFILPLFWLLDNYNMNYGIIILIMTILIKIILTPLTYKSYLSQVKMRILKPELDELREKYKNDQQRFGQEQMKIFSQAGVNPLGGCLPMLFQMPILVAMYTFFPNSIELRQQGFLWAHDLTAYDSILNFGFDIPFYGDHVSLFTILMTLTSLAMAYYNSQVTSMTGQMKWMQYLMPVFLLGIFNNLSAALTYYYFLFNLLTLIQQWAMQRFWIDEKAIHARIQENKKKPLKKGGWVQRLEEAAKKKQQMNQQRKK